MACGTVVGKRYHLLPCGGNALLHLLPPGAPSAPCEAPYHRPLPPDLGCPQPLANPSPLPPPPARPPLARTFDAALSSECERPDSACWCSATQRSAHHCQLGSSRATASEALGVRVRVRVRTAEAVGRHDTQQHNDDPVSSKRSEGLGKPCRAVLCRAVLFLLGSCPCLHVGHSKRVLGG